MLRWTLVIIFLPSIAPAMELTLEDAIRRAGTLSTQVVVSRERVMQIVSRLGQARSALYPRVSATASATRQTKNLEVLGVPILTERVVGPFDILEARARLQQTLFNPEVFRRLEAAKSERTLSEAEAAKARLDAMALGGMLFIEARRAHFSLELAEANLRRDETRSNVARARKRSGTGTIVDEQVADQRLLDSRQAETSAAAEADSSRLDLLAVLDFPLESTITFGAWRIPLSTAAAAVHPDLASAQAEVHLREAEVSTIQGGGYPTLAANMDLGYSGRRIDSMPFTYSYGGQINWDLNMSQRHSETEGAKSTLRAAEARLRDAERKLAAARISADEDVARAESLLRTQQSALEVAQAGAELARARLRQGVGTRLEKLEAEADASLARDRLEEAQAFYWTARLRLARASGTLGDLP